MSPQEPATSTADQPGRSGRNERRWVQSSAVLSVDGFRTSTDLAQAAGAHALSLYRVMRLLASVGVFAEDEDGRFQLTPLAECLRTGGPGSMRSYVITRGEEWLWRPWGALLHAVRNGDVAFEHVFGVGLFDYLAQRPEAAASEKLPVTTAATANR